MKVLVVAKPRFPIPPEMLPQLLEGAIDWYRRYQERFLLFGTFPGGGGFGAVDVADEKELARMMAEMPFSPFGEQTVTPFVEGDEGFRQFQQVLGSMGVGTPA